MVGKKFEQMQTLGTSQTMAWVGTILSPQLLEGTITIVAIITIRDTLKPFSSIMQQKTYSKLSKDGQSVSKKKNVISYDYCKHKGLMKEDCLSSKRLPRDTRTHTCVCIVTPNWKLVHLRANSGKVSQLARYCQGPTTPKWGGLIPKEVKDQQSP